MRRTLSVLDGRVEGRDGLRMGLPEEIAPGIRRWAAPHPRWRAGVFGREVGSYALDLPGGDLLLVDPLLPPGVREALDPLARAAAHVHVYVTIPYHVRDTARAVERWGAQVWGERRTARRLAPAVTVRDAEPGADLPFGRCLAIGRPVRAERPLWVPGHAALVFGDALVVTPGGDLVVWTQDRLDARRRAFYAERFAPSLSPLLDLPAERILVTHGAPVLRGGARALRAAVAAEPWYHHG
jgi:hypothetical protein